MISLSDNYFSHRADIEKTFYEFLEEGTILKALDNSEDPIGFICYMPKGVFHGFPYIHTFTVLPGRRGSGYGRKMLDFFESEFVKDSSKLFLLVADFNPRAKSFYEKNGFLYVGVLPDLYRPEIDEFLMMKVLK